MPEADAAAVASKLLDFLREPARYRPRYINGQEAIAGRWVFKFAQARFPHAILRAFDRQDRERIREAARAFIRQVCFREAATHFEMLGVHATSRPEVVKENYHLLMALIHPDRQESRGEAWPTGCAQRVNQAYAVLCDDRQRRAYEAGLKKIGNGVAHAVPPVAGVQVPYVPLSPARRRRRTLRAAMLVTAVIATLLFVQLTWVSELPAEYRLLERAYPIDASAQWMRSVFSSTEAPRFVTENAVLPRASDASEVAEPEPLPKMRRRPVRTDMAIAVEPAALPAEAPPPAPHVTQPLAIPTPVSSPAAGNPAPAAEQAIRVAQAAPVTTGPAISNADIETLIAQLVSSYESGDLEGLMSLVDRTEASSARGMRMRQLYDEFFRATRERHLRLNAIAWQVSSAAAQARGEADLSARYGEQVAAVERRVAVEMDIGVRDGRARITRLALFPGGG